MRASTVEYHAPARFDDLLEVFVRVARIGTTSVTYEHAAYRLDRTTTTADGDREADARADRPRTTGSPRAGAGRVPRRRSRRSSDERQLRSRRSTGSSKRGGDADDVLREVVAALVERGRLRVGRDPLRRERRARARPGGRHGAAGDRVQVPVVYGGDAASPSSSSTAAATGRFLERVALA